jgi:hypothetical protein
MGLNPKAERGAAVYDGSIPKFFEILLMELPASQGTVMKA